MVERVRLAAGATIMAFLVCVLVLIFVAARAMGPDDACPDRARFCADLAGDLAYLADDPALPVDTVVLRTAAQYCLPVEDHDELSLRLQTLRAHLGESRASEILRQLGKDITDD